MPGDRGAKAKQPFTLAYTPYDPHIMQMLKQFILNGFAEELPKGSSSGDCIALLGQPEQQGTMQKSGHVCLVYAQGLTFEFDTTDHLHSVRYVGTLDEIGDLVSWPKLMMVKVDQTRYAFIRATANEDDEAAPQS